MNNAERNSVLLITSELSFTLLTNKLGKPFFWLEKFGCNKLLYTELKRNKLVLFLCSCFQLVSNSFLRHYCLTIFISYKFAVYGTFIISTS